MSIRRTETEPRRGFFSGYLKNEKATEEAWRGGWFHTGDTVVKDETGMHFFMDRKKNIIRRGRRKYRSSGSRGLFMCTSSRKTGRRDCGRG